MNPFTSILDDDQQQDFAAQPLTASSEPPVIPFAPTTLHSIPSSYQSSSPLPSPSPPPKKRLKPSKPNFSPSEQATISRARDYLHSTPPDPIPLPPRDPSLPPPPPPPPHIPGTRREPSRDYLRRPTLPSDPPPIPASATPIPQGYRVKGAGKGRKGRIGPDGRFISTDSIVEQCRALLADSWPDGDVRKALARQFGGSANGYRKHIAMARKKNLAQLNRTLEESKSDAMQQWQRLLAEAQVEKRRIYANLTAAQKELTIIRQRYEETPEALPEFMALHSLIDSKEKSLIAINKEYASARYHVDKYQNTIDRMLGHMAPNRTEAIVNSNSTSTTMSLTASLTPPEPLTLEDADRQLKDMLSKLRGETMTANMTGTKYIEAGVVQKEIEEPVPVEPENPKYEWPVVVRRVKGGGIEHVKEVEAGRASKDGISSGSYGDGYDGGDDSNEGSSEDSQGQ